MAALFVSTPESIHADRELGRRLAGYLGGMTTPNAAQIQALVADLLAEDQAFQAPVRDLIGRAAFLSMLPRIGRGAGRLERDALLLSLAPTYSAAVLERLAAFLDGLLNLAPGADDASAPVALQVPASAQVAASVQVAAADGDEPSLPVPASRGGRLLRRVALVAIAGVTAGVTAGAVLVLRSGVLCSLSASLPFCGAATADGAGQQGRTPEQEISSGLQAARDLATASDLPSFERALQQLETSLLPLATGDLPPALAPQRDGLEAIVRTARERLRQEQSDRQGLELARTAMDQALRQSDASAIAAVDAAIRRLQEIRSGSFSEADARLLLRDLDAARLRLQQTVTVAPPTTPPAVDAGGSAPAPSSTGEGGGAASGREGNRGQRGEPLF